MTDQLTAGRARDLTPEEADERMKRLTGLERQIHAGLRAGRATMWAVAQSLYEWDEEAGWSALGYESIGDWLSQPEIGMSRKTYYRSVQMWREFVVVRRLDPEKLLALDIGKVEVVLPALKAGRVDLDDALSDAEALGRADLRDKYYGPDQHAREPGDPPADHSQRNGHPDPEPVECDGSGTCPAEEHIEGCFKGDDVIEGTAVEPEASVSAPDVEGVRSAVDRARGALEMPQRLSGARQTVRAALEDLISEIEALELWDREA